MGSRARGMQGFAIESPCPPLTRHGASICAMGFTTHAPYHTLRGPPGLAESHHAVAAAAAAHAAPWLHLRDGHAHLRLQRD
jgi:hypothetical protein